MKNWCVVCVYDTLICFNDLQIVQFLPDLNLTFYVHLYEMFGYLTYTIPGNRKNPASIHRNSWKNVSLYNAKDAGFNVYLS